MSKPLDFNIYYLNFSKVYEIAMMINNIILTKIERDNTTGSSEEYCISSELSAEGSEKFLMGIKSSSLQMQKRPIIPLRRL